MRYLLAGVAVVAYLPLAPQAQAETHEITLNRIPAPAGECHAIAAEVGERFKDITGLEEVRSICAGSEDDGQEVLLRYRAPEALTHVSTAATSGTLQSPGAYTTRERCVQAVPEQTRRFEEATGLQALYPYCFQDPFARHYEWGIRVDGFGEAEKAPRYAGAAFFGSPLGVDRQAFEAAIFAGLEDNGVDVVWTRARPSSAYGELNVFYYADEPQHLSVVEGVKVRDSEQCLGQLEEFTAIWNELPQQPLHTYCAGQRIGGYYELTAVLWSPHRVRKAPVFHSPETWENYETCRSEKDELIEHYRTELDRPVVGGLCEKRDRSTWGLALFEEPFTP